MNSIKTSSRRSASLPAEGRNVQQGTEKEAFLGGLPNMKADKLKIRAEEFVGNPGGLVGVKAPGKAANHVFIQFTSEDVMRQFVADNNERVTTAGLRLKHNRSQPLSNDERTRRNTIWKGKQALINAGLIGDAIIFNRKRFWQEGSDGSLV